MTYFRLVRNTMLGIIHEETENNTFENLDNMGVTVSETDFSKATFGFSGIIALTSILVLLLIIRKRKVL